MGAEFEIISLKMIATLIIIVGLILLLFYILKRFQLTPISNKIPSMKLLGTLNLAPKRAIALVEICNQWLIIGVGTENVSLISKVDRPSESDFSDPKQITKESKFQSFLENFSLSQRRNFLTGNRQNEKT